MFPHLIPLVQHLNDGGRRHVIDGQIVKHGSYENQTAEDVSWSCDAGKTGARDPQGQVRHPSRASNRRGWRTGVGQAQT